MHLLEYIHRYHLRLLTLATRFTVKRSTLIRTIVRFTANTTIEIKCIFNWRYLHDYIVVILSRKIVIDELVYVVLMSVIDGACFLYKTLRQRSTLFNGNVVKLQATIIQYNFILC